MTATLPNIQQHTLDPGNMELVTHTSVKDDEGVEMPMRDHDHGHNAIAGALWGILFSLPVWALIGLAIWYFFFHH